MHLKLFHEDVTDLASPELLAAFHESETMIRQIIGLTRRLTVDLSPLVLQSEGLVEALRWLASHMARLYQLEVTIEAAVSPRLYSTELRIFLVQLVRELLFNIVKHAEVKQAQVIVTSLADALMVEVRDRGRGFDVAQILATPSVAGYGLCALQERLALFDGQMTIHSVIGGGTQITLRLPLAGVDTPLGVGP